MGWNWSLGSLLGHSAVSSSCHAHPRDKCCYWERVPALPGYQQQNGNFNNWNSLFHTLNFAGLCHSVTQTSSTQLIELKFFIDPLQCKPMQGWWEGQCEPPGTDPGAQGEIWRNQWWWWLRLTWSPTGLPLSCRQWDMVLCSTKLNIIQTSCATPYCSNCWLWLNSFSQF